MEKWKMVQCVLILIFQLLLLEVKNLEHGGGGGVTNGGSQGAVDLGDFMVKGEEERVTEVR